MNSGVVQQKILLFWFHRFMWAAIWGPQKRTIFPEYVTRRRAEKHSFMLSNQILAWTSSRTSAWPTQCGKGPSLGCFLIQVKKRHHRHRDEIIVSPVVDWPYRLAYVNASIEDMAPTHRQQYLMVKSMKRHKERLFIYPTKVLLNMESFRGISTLQSWRFFLSWPHGLSLFMHQQFLV